MFGHLNLWKAADILPQRHLIRQVTPVVVQEIVPKILSLFLVTGWRTEKQLFVIWYHPHVKLPSGKVDTSRVDLIWRQFECTHLSLRFLSLWKVIPRCSYSSPTCRSLVRTCQYLQTHCLICCPLWEYPRTPSRGDLLGACSSLRFSRYFIPCCV